MTLRDYYRIIKRRLWIITITFIIITLIYVLLVFSKPTIYQASSSIMLQPPKLEMRFAELAFPNIARATRFMNLPNQLTLMRSKRLAEKVIQYIKKKNKIDVTLPEVITSTNITGDEPTHLITITVTSKDPKKAKAIANAYAIISVDENKKLSQAEHTSAKNYIDEQLKRYKKKLIDTEEELTIFNKTYGVIDFSEDIETRINRISEYRAQIETVNIRLRKNEEIAKKWRNKLITCSEFKQISELVPNPELEDLKKRLTELKNTLWQLENQYQASHPKVRAINSQIAELKERIRQIKLNQLMPKRIERIIESEKSILSKAGPKFKQPEQTLSNSMETEYIRIPKTIPNPMYQYYAQRLADIESEQVSLIAEKEALNTLLSSDEILLSNLKDEEAKYAALKKDIATTERILHNLEDLQENIKVMSAMELGNAQIVDLSKEAIAISKFTLTSLMFIILLAAVTGFIAGLVVEFLDDTIRTSYHVKRYLNLLLLGSIPKIEEKEYLLIFELTPTTPIVDIYSRLALQLQQECIAKDTKTILITSAKLGEGKTSILINLGYSLTQAGEKVLLVDTDMRRSTIHRIFNLSNAYGVSSILSGELIVKERIEKLKEEVEYEEIDRSEILDKTIMKTKYPNLFVLPAGPSPLNPTSLLTSVEAKELVTEVKNKFTKVLFDSPPLLTTADASTLTLLVDGVIFILDAENIKRQEAQRAKQILTNLRAKILGVILNKSIIEEETYYYKYYRSKKY